VVGLGEQHEERGVCMHQQHLDQQRAEGVQQVRGGGAHPEGLVAERVGKIGVRLYTGGGGGVGTDRVG